MTCPQHSLHQVEIAPFAAVNQSAVVGQHKALSGEFHIGGKHEKSCFGHIGAYVGYRPIIVVGGAGVLRRCGFVHMQSHGFGIALFYLGKHAASLG